MGKSKLQRKYEGILEDIYKVLIEPILKCKPDNYDRDEYLARIWQTDKYIIKKYIIKRRFDMPGRPFRYVNFGVKARSKFREVIPGEVAWIRFNENESIDVEVPVSPRGYHSTFQLTTKQWDDIKIYFKEVEFFTDIE